jgi:glycerate 2-kinase
METIVRDLFATAIKAVDPAEAAGKYADKLHTSYRDGGFSRLLVIGFGKASVPMARSIEALLGGIVDADVIITKYGHASDHGLQKIRVHEAGHPLPDENGVQGTEAILRLVETVDERTLVAVLVSGGGSALFVAPCAGISFAEKQETTSLLLRAGAKIQELNAVRKHLSRVKGGRLAELLYPAATVSLILSDVIGDHLDVIASGPTAPDSTTCSDALDILEKYCLRDRVPPPVIKLLENGKNGLLPETPKQSALIFNKVENIIIGSNRLALSAAKAAAEAQGMMTEIITAEIAGEAVEVGRRLAMNALTTKLYKESPAPVCLISGGETTVTVTGAGKGGRSMELALAFAIQIEGVSGITLLSAGTDGTDGPTDAAGAIVDGTTVMKARDIGLDPEEYLGNNDSYTFFREAGGLLVTGPTGTNVMDVQIMVLT